MEPIDVVAQLANGFAEAWNCHDMGDLGRLFHEDASFVNVVGMLMQGRPQIQQVHGEIHAGPYRGSELSVQVQDGRALSAEVTVGHVRTELTGDERAPGEARPTLLTIVATRRHGAWRIAAAHNTAITVRPT